MTDIIPDKKPLRGGDNPRENDLKLTEAPKPSLMTMDSTVLSLW